MITELYFINKINHALIKEVHFIGGNMASNFMFVTIYHFSDYSLF